MIPLLLAGDLQPVRLEGGLDEIHHLGMRRREAGEKVEIPSAAVDHTGHDQTAAAGES